MKKNDNDAFITLIKELGFVKLASEGRGFGFKGEEAYQGRMGRDEHNPIFLEIKDNRCRLTLTTFPNEEDYIKDFEATAKGLIIALTHLRYKDGQDDKAAEIRDALYCL